MRFYIDILVSSPLLLYRIKKHVCDICVLYLHAGVLYFLCDWVLGRRLVGY